MPSRPNFTKGKHSLARWLFPSTIVTMEMKIERLKEENQNLKRRIARMESDLEKLRADPFFYPFWATKDWDKAYGPTDDKT